jgi:hypothetical protein
MSYMNAVSQILRRGNFSNSYKFALLRSLAAFGSLPGNGEEEISRERLAEHFVKLYWPITLHFQLRQENDPTKPPKAMKFIKSVSDNLGLSPEVKLDVFRINYPDQYIKLKKRVGTGSFNDVIKCFHNIPKSDPVKPRLFTHDENNLGKGIVIPSEARGFLKENHQTLDLLAIGGWVKFTEMYTSAPRLYEKIRGIVPERSDTKPYCNFFLNQGETHCFYCSCSLEAKPEVDHVIPWSYMAENKVWNLVLACRDCNGSGGKSNRMPNDDFIKTLNQRNEEILSLAPDDLPQKIKTDLAEWRGQRTDLVKHIEMLVGRCEADGFDRWEPA